MIRLSLAGVTRTSKFKRLHLLMQTFRDSSVDFQELQVFMVVGCINPPQLNKQGWSKRCCTQVTNFLKCSVCLFDGFLLSWVLVLGFFFVLFWLSLDINGINFVSKTKHTKALLQHTRSSNSNAQTPLCSGVFKNEYLNSVIQNSGLLKLQMTCESSPTTCATASAS